MPQHFSKVVCPFRGYFVNYGSALDSGWADERCIGPRCAKWATGTHTNAAGTTEAGYCSYGTPHLPQLLDATPQSE